MNTSSKILSTLAVVSILVLGIVGAAIALILPGSRDVTGPGSTGDPTPVEDHLEDGEWFGFVSFDDRDGSISIDPAELLTGDAAHDAAVEAGVISEGETLPNDMFIVNDDHRIRTHLFADGPVISVLDGNRPWETLQLTDSDLVALFEGTYAGDPVYGLSAAEPFPMTVTIADGLVTGASQVYLP